MSRQAAPSGARARPAGLGSAELVLGAGAARPAAHRPRRPRAPEAPEAWTRRVSASPARSPQVLLLGTHGLFAVLRLLRSGFALFFTVVRCFRFSVSPAGPGCGASVLAGAVGSRVPCKFRSAVRSSSPVFFTIPPALLGRGRRRLEVGARLVRTPNVTCLFSPLSPPLGFPCTALTGI